MSNLLSSFTKPLSLTESEIRLRTPEPAFDTICIARQPILDFHKNLVAYELLFRSLDGQIAAPASGLQTTLSVIHNAFHGIGIEAVLGSLPGFINVDADFLMSDLIESLPTKPVVLEILESVEPTAEIVARVRELKEQGYKFALDDYTGEHERYAALLPEMDVVKFDLVEIEPVQVAAIVTSLRRLPCQLLAEKVETKKDFLRTRALNFDLYQGYHFARPEMMSGRELKASAPAQLLRLLTLLTQDADTDELVEELKRQPALSYNLIRIANSSAIGARHKISSIQEAALILGRRQLLHVVQVLMYASQGSNAQHNPLLQMAIVRSRLMEKLAGLVETGNGDFQEAAFLTGMLSLIDVLIQMPIEEILMDLPVATVVRDALLERSGQLGTLLRLCEHLDEHDEAGVRRELSEIPSISGSNLMAMQLEAFTWGQRLGL